MPQFFHFNNKPVSITVDAVPSRYNFYALTDGAATGTFLFAYTPQSQISSLASVINQIGDYAVIQVADSSRYSYYGTDGTPGGSRLLFTYQGQSNVIETSSLLNVVNGRDVIAVNDGGIYSLYGTNGTQAGSQLLFRYDAHAQFSSSVTVVDVMDDCDIIRVVAGQTYAYYCTNGTLAGTRLLFSYTATGPFSSASLIEYAERDTVVINDNGRLHYFNITCGVPGVPTTAQKLFEYGTATPAPVTASATYNGLDYYAIYDGVKYAYFTSDGTLGNTRYQFAYQPISPTAGANLFDTIGTRAVLEVHDALSYTYYSVDSATGLTSLLFKAATTSPGATSTKLGQLPGNSPFSPKDIIAITDNGVYKVYATDGSQGFNSLTGSYLLFTYNAGGGDNSITMHNFHGSISGTVEIRDDNLLAVYATGGYAGGTSLLYTWNTGGGKVTYLADDNGSINDMYLVENNGRYTVLTNANMPNGSHIALDYNAGGGTNAIIVMDTVQYRTQDLFLIQDDSLFSLYATNAITETNLIYSYDGHGGSDSASLVNVIGERYVMQINDDDGHFVFVASDGSTLPPDPGNHQHGTEAFLTYDAGGGVNSASLLVNQYNVDWFVINDDNVFHLFASNTYSTGTYDAFDFAPVNANGSVTLVASAAGHALIATQDGEDINYYDINNGYVLTQVSDTPDLTHWWV